MATNNISFDDSPFPKFQILEKVKCTCGDVKHLVYKVTFPDFHEFIYRNKPWNHKQIKIKKHEPTTQRTFSYMPESVNISFLLFNATFL